MERPTLITVGQTVRVRSGPCCGWLGTVVDLPPHGSEDRGHAYFVRFGPRANPNTFAWRLADELVAR